MLLGYEPRSYVKVYQTKCTGICLSLRLQPTTCQPTYKRVIVSTMPGSNYGLHVVTVISSCGCKGKPCTVTSPLTGATTTYLHGATALDACDHKVWMGPRWMWVSRWLKIPSR